jgi:hypothetical protein
VLRRYRRESLERGTRSDEVPHLSPRDEAGLREQEGGVTVVAGVRRRLFGQREHAIPIAALLAVRVRQEEERAFILRIELDGALEKFCPALEALVARDPPRAEHECHLRTSPAIGDVREDLGLEGLDLVEPSRLREDTLVKGGCLLR